MAANRLVEREQVATYASVLLDAACEEGDKDRALTIRNELNLVTQVIRSSLGACDALSDSMKTPQELNKKVHELFADCDPLLVEVLAVMAERQDIGKLARVCADYEEQLHNRLNVTVVDVTTAVVLTKVLRDKITKKLSADLGTDVVLNEHVDASILGGIIMSANGRRIDASITAQLDHARSMLTKITDGGERS